MDLLAYWRTLWRHKWGISALVIAVGLLAMLYAHSLEPLYRAHSSLLIDLGANRVSPVKADVGGDSWMAYYRSLTYYETQIRLFKSQSLAEKVVDRLTLWEHPEYDPRQQAESRAKYPELAELRKHFTWKDLLFWLPKQEPVAVTEVDEETLKRQIARSLAAGIQARRHENTDIIALSFTSSDPKLAADIVNAYAEEYIEMGMNNRLEMMQRAGFWLTDKMSELRITVRDSEQRLQRFIERSEILSDEAAGALVSRRFNDVSEQLRTAQQRLMTLEDEHRALRRLQLLSHAEIAMDPVAMSNARVQNLKNEMARAQTNFNDLAARYGPKHPNMQTAERELASITERIDAEIRIAVAAAAEELSNQRVRVQRLEGSLNELRDELQEANRQEFTLRAMRREAEVNRELYDAFLTKFKETNVALDMDTANAKVIDAAEVPRGAVAPNKNRIIMMATMLALVVGIGLVLLLEMLDSTLKNGDDVEQRLGLPTLGTLQLLGKKQVKEKSPARYVLEDSKSGFAESIRTIRSGVLLSGLDNPHKIVMLTSTVPGEGKTTVAINLALALGQMERVVLVDADMRRPSVGKYFEIPKDKPGLSDLVAGKASEEEVLHQVEEGLSVLAAGVIPPNPSELLSSKRFASCMERLAEHYDRVVIDSAPVQAVSDPILISKVASGVLYVVRADATPYPLVQAALKRLYRARAVMIGVVLNQQDLRKSARYAQYGKYGAYSRYGRHYDSYYQHDYYR